MARERAVGEGLVATAGCERRAAGDLVESRSRRRVVAVRASWSLREVEEGQVGVGLLLLPRRRYSWDLGAFLAE